jgi:hypothetical protein
VYVGGLKALHPHSFKQSACAFKSVLVMVALYIQQADTYQRQLANFLVEVEFKERHKNGCNLPQM